MDPLAIGVGIAVLWWAVLALWFFRNWRSEHCPKCYYPVRNCDCERDRHGEDVERSVRSSSSGPR